MTGRGSLLNSFLRAVIHPDRDAAGDNMSYMGDLAGICADYGLRIGGTVAKIGLSANIATTAANKVQNNFCIDSSQCPTETTIWGATVALRPFHACMVSDASPAPMSARG